MPEQNKVNILGIDVVRLEAEEAVQESLRMVKDPRPGMIYFLTAESSLLCRNSADAADFVNRCDLVLPGDLHTEKAFQHLKEDSAPEEADGRYAESYMNQLFALMNTNELSIYAVMDSEETLTKLQEYILTNYPGINLDGILMEKDSEGEFGRIVNDINACVPDIVFICLPPEVQISFAGKFSSMMNTGLCICIESMHPWIQSETAEVPGFFRAIGGERFYLWLKKERKVREMITGSIFRQHVLTDAAENVEAEAVSGTEPETAQSAETAQSIEAEAVSGAEPETFSGDVPEAAQNAEAEAISGDEPETVQSAESEAGDGVSDRNSE